MQMSQNMNNNKIVSDTEWVEARKQLLMKEKAFSKQRDELTKLRRQLPWRKIEADYEFEGANGKQRLSALFGEQSQLIVYHFMFGPDWTEGCRICSLLSDHYDPLVVHLKARDVSLVTISNAPYEKLAAFKRRMGWSFDWLSSVNNPFNRDFGVSFTQQEMDEGTMMYNYQLGKFPSTECPGISSFYKNPQDEVFHTYSAYARGLENFLGIYNFLDIVPKGRDEDGLSYGMEWVRYHDRYDDETAIDKYIDLMG
jgi:predicted dithiol-disulfide oxidoreductase (DUF899 family)